jgi:hypothetical protein
MEAVVLQLVGALKTLQHLNVLNLSLLEKNVDMFKVKDKISAIVEKCHI